MRHNVDIGLLTSEVIVALVLGLSACRGGRAPAALNPTPRSSVATEVGATSGPVALMVERLRYMSDDTIVASIHNTLATPIFARDGRSDCAVVDLERWVNISWQIQAPCVNMQPTPHIAQIAPNAVLTQQLAPGLSDSSIGSWPAGTYRIAFAYVSSADQPFGQSTVIYSASFTIG